MVNGTIYGMKLRMDKSGRIVFPKPLRKRLGLGSAGELEAVEQPGGGILLRPTVHRPSMAQVDGLWVHLMDIFFDTTVLVAASSSSHPHHTQAFPALRRVATRRDNGFISTHSIAEVYAALTRMPVEPRIHPVEAARIVTDNLLPHFEAVALTKEDYLEAMAMMKDGGWSGAKIYDALLLCCAARCSTDRIYTFNLSDFKLLAPAGLRNRICAP
jgi:AbrB family looped-hinge helix DNA binding protein